MWRTFPDVSTQGGRKPVIQQSNNTAPRDYQSFLTSKRISAPVVGFDVPASELNPFLSPWQRVVVRWALRRGRAAFFEDCGLGKTFQQLEWASHVSRHSLASGGTGETLLLCPVAVAEQTVREAAKFQIATPVRIIEENSEVLPGINICNYEKLHKLDCRRFAGVVLDESSILKNYTGKTKRQLCDEFSHTRFKLACTATPAPNDQMELGNHSEFLGVMNSNEMLARWFINDSMKCGGYRVSKHAESDFWQWVCSWAVAISRPSDIGFSDAGYILPNLNIIEHVIESEATPGFLFNAGKAVSATKVHTEKRAALAGKAKIVAELVRSEPDEPWVIWVDTDYEADAVRKLLPEAVEIRGSQSTEEKRAGLCGFSDGTHRWIVTKASLGGLGMNWQHCRRTTYFAGFSFENWYQSIRRLWRFGQQSPVDVHLVMGDNEESVADTLRRKNQDYLQMAGEMSKRMKAGMQNELGGVRVLRKSETNLIAMVPEWIQTRED